MDRYVMQDRKQAIEFANTVRGQYILSQALTLAIGMLEGVEPPVMREVSNIADMKYLRDTLFPIFAELEKIKQSEMVEG